MEVNDNILVNEVIPEQALVGVKNLLEDQPGLHNPKFRQIGSWRKNEQTRNLLF